MATFKGIEPQAVDRPIESISRIWAESYTQEHERDSPDRDLGRCDGSCRLEGVATIACLARSDGRNRGAGPETTSSSTPDLSQWACSLAMVNFTGMCG